MADEELEDSWMALRPDVDKISDGNLRFTPEQILEVARALAGEDGDFLEIDPDRLPEEETTPNGLIVPAGTIASVSDPEFIGRMPVRTELTVLSANDPGQRTIGFFFRELTDADLDERDSPENLQRLADQRDAPADHYNSSQGFEYEADDHVGWTVIPVLHDLWGKPWNAASMNFLRSLRPSMVRVIEHRGAMTCDAMTWRVTVILAEGNRDIERIEQEVEVNLRGFRNGHDASLYLRGLHEHLEQPQPRAYINPRGIALLQLDRDDG